MKFLPINRSLQLKTLLFSLLIVIFPFIVSNVFWYISAESTLYKERESQLVFAAQDAADRANTFLNTKLLGFLSHSQNAALLSSDPKLIREDLSILLQQDPDIEILTYADVNGREIVKIDRNKVYGQKELSTVKDTPAFKVATFKFGQEYIGPVRIAEDKSVYMTIGVPVALPEDTHSLLTFTSGSTRTQLRPNQVYGVLIGEVNVTRFAKNITTLKVAKSGYMYVIDNTGAIIGHPDESLVGEHKRNSLSPRVQEFLKKEAIGIDVYKPYQGTSIVDIPVLTTMASVPRAGWVTIIEEPKSAISEDIVAIQQQALLLLIVPLLFAFVLSFLFARRLTQPIQELVKGTIQVGKGNFDYKFSIKTGDELEKLAHEYHTMAVHLKHERRTIVDEKDTLSLVLGNIADGVIAINDNYNIQFINDAAVKILRLPVDEVSGKNLDSFLKFKDHKKEITFADLCKQSDNKLSVYKLEALLNTKESVTIRLTIAPLKKRTDSQIHYLITFDDVTKEEELEKMKLDFVSMAAHELRTPLTSLKGYMSLLKQTAASKLTDDEKLYLQRSMISSDQLQSLVENILNISRIEQGRLEIKKTEVSLEKIAGDVVSNLQDYAQQKGIQLLYTNPPQQLPKVHADEMKISEVFSNLISNAVNYNKPNGWVKVQLEQKSDQVVATIEDNGVGIAESAIAHLFTKFYRVSRPLEMGSKGTGLGLYISKKIIDAHSGKIWAESQEGKGTKFNFSLPIEQAQH